MPITEIPTDNRITIEADEKSCAILRDHILNPDLRKICVFIPLLSSNEIIITSPVSQKSHFKPVRFGDILDTIIETINKMNGENLRLIKIGDHTLDTHLSLWMNADGKNIRLTDKESDLLFFLTQAESRELSRENLLKKVWDYVDGVETHTLETHIYRLRQKIEHDPSNPKILVTTDIGYQITS